MDENAAHLLGLERCLQCNKFALAGDTVTITVEEYAALKEAATTTARRKKIASYRAVSGSSIAKNPEMAEFIIECAATMTTAEVHAACLGRFGETTPSWSTVFRFIQAIKRGGVI